MRVTAQFDLSAQPNRVIALLADPALLEQAAGGEQKAGATVRHHEDGGFTLTVRRPVPLQDVPPAARAMATDALELRQAIAWLPAGPDGSRDGTMAGEIAGAPVYLEGTVHLAPSGSGSVLSIAGELTARVPLVGPAIEQAGARMVIKVISDQVAALEQRLLGEGKPA